MLQSNFSKLYFPKQAQVPLIAAKSQKSSTEKIFGISMVIQPSISMLAEESYLDTATADVNFIFKIGRRKKNKQFVRVPAHRILLKLRSDVFNAMFYGELRELGDVHIVDATADVFKEFLKLFYFDKPIIEMVHIPDVLQLIRKYNVTGCLDYYDIVLDKSIKIDNVCWIYNLALEFQMPLSKSHCERQISLKAEEIFQSSDFLERSYKTVLQIVSLNNFACEEYTIFKACITWAQEECLREGLEQSDLLNIRNQLQGLLYQIRFRSMNSIHVGDVIKEYHSLFTNDELADLALIALSHSDPKTLISKAYRNNAWDTCELLSCDFTTITDYQKKELERFEPVTFWSNEQIVLRQIRLKSLYVNKVKVEKYEPANLKLQIIEKCIDCEKTVYNSNHRLEFKSWITIPKMILIRPLVKYEIRLDYWDITDNRYRVYERSSSGVITHTINGNKSDFPRKIIIKISGRATSISAIRFCETNLPNIS